MREKKTIVVGITATVQDPVTLVADAVENAMPYADDICVALHGASSGIGKKSQQLRQAVNNWARVHEIPTTLSPRGRGQANKFLDGVQGARMIRGTNTPAQVPSGRSLTGVYLEAGQRIDDPAVVRDAVELNSGQILVAVRRFLWDDDHYREDGVFAPIPLPFAGPYGYNATWTEGYRTAPDWMWQSKKLWLQAPIEIIDVTFSQQDTKDEGKPPKLRPVYGETRV